MTTTTADLIQSLARSVVFNVTRCDGSLLDEWNILAKEYGERIAEAAIQEANQRMNTPRDKKFMGFAPVEPR